MLIEPVIRPRGPAGLQRRQGGVVLIVALIVLVAMTLAGLALVRSMDTSNIIAGNLAFRQSTAYSSAAGIEAAVNWLETNNVGTTLESDLASQGYRAMRSDPSPTQTWDNFWSAQLVNQAAPPFVDAAGNTVTYAIQRLCGATGSSTASGSGCSRPVMLTGAGGGGSMRASSIAIPVTTQVYYRITTRITGPRNTVSYVQTIVAL